MKQKAITIDATLRFARNGKFANKMLQIKFARIGKKKQPTYRIIISEKSKDTFGDFLEILGHYNPCSKETSLKEDRIKYWLGKGAQATDTVHNLLIAKGIIKGKKKKAFKISKKRMEKIKGKKKSAEEKPKQEVTPVEEAKAPEQEPPKAPAEEVKTPETETAQS